MRSMHNQPSEPKLFWPFQALGFASGRTAFMISGADHCPKHLLYRLSWTGSSNQSLKPILARPEHLRRDRDLRNIVRVRLTPLVTAPYATPIRGYTSRRLNPVAAVRRSMVIAR